MKGFIIVISLILMIVFACKERVGDVEPLKVVEDERQVVDSTFILSTWVHGKKEFDQVDWEQRLKTYDSLGISELLVQGNPDFLTKLLPLATAMNMKVHAWMWTLNQPGNKETQQHPEWYAVNRNGQHSLEYRAYVDYYQWLSPFHPDACEYIKDKVRSYCEVEGLASVHLDYVRYVDVILGADLQPKYKIKQETELPEYDYGYHPIARAGFKALFGKDPIEMEHPELSTEWRQYRLNAVTELVNAIAVITKEHNIELTAAVFPFPEMSRQMVRQAWNDWNLNAAYPMLYHNFYRESINWIGFATQQGVRDVDFPIHAGLYSPALRSPKELEQAILITKENGAKGMCIFTADDLTVAQKEVFIKLKAIL
ncbi:family 10 glycosylhydrolase [Aureispira anguillae]|uniref:Family 10 glycosylhydrolase n=1 Tax=Aureispira anguillae TaxID=2864201 RepID=A0A915YFK9_9BACT|nr:family 10 glycosylhydrolase [Aureispira anguillae]BDS12245.1 family 10 glycosylhydrolase [Aureispira anguillae]